jgi:preprotein translocase subunit SecD
MKMRRMAFKSCLGAGLTLALLCGCQSSPGKPKGLVATLRLHLEMNADRSDRSTPVPIHRANPFLVNVEKAPFLDERSVTNAAVVEAMGGFAIQVQFDTTGARLLEQYSTANRGRRCAIFTQFGDKNPQPRWLAAPLLSRTITDGVLVFTPDATREEAEQIVRGLLNLKKEIQKRGQW